MKDRDLIKKVEKAGCKFLRHGGNHDIYIRESDGMEIQIPRHKEVNEGTARKILKQLGLK